MTGGPPTKTLSNDCGFTNQNPNQWLELYQQNANQWLELY